MESLESRFDLLSPVRAVFESNPLLLWALLGCLLFVVSVAWPRLRAWHSKRAVEAASAREDLLEEMRVARLKQSDAMRAALEMQKDVKTTSSSSAPKSRDDHRPVAPRPAPAARPVFFTHQQQQQQRRPPRFGRLPPGGGGGS